MIVRHSSVEVGGGYKRYTHQDETQLSAVAYTVLYPVLEQTGECSNCKLLLFYSIVSFSLSYAYLPHDNTVTAKAITIQMQTTFDYLCA